MPNIFDFLVSRVGRRLVALFGVCALLPLLGLAALSRRAIGEYLLTAGYEELRAGSKSYAMSLTDRLQLLEVSLRETTAHLDAGDLTPQRLALLEERFAWVGLLSEDGSIETLVGPPGDAPSAAELSDLQTRAAKLTIQSSQKPLLALGRESPKGGPGMLVARLYPSFLWWGATEDETLPPGTEMLVLADDEILFSSYPNPTALADRVLPAMRSPDGHRAVVEWDFDQTDFVAGYFTLPLALQFVSDDWTIVWSRARGDLLRPARQFSLPFLLVLTATFLGVVLLALWQIRRFLQPLEELRRGTGRLASQDFSTAVEVSSRDEFEDLAVAFNDMSRRLGDVLSDLRRHQLGTLRALARAIDERSSWTLGHSGRVANLARRIARQMDLSIEDAEALHRAALLHDIGKLRLPTELLEKPGSLTADELGEVQEHVNAGLRILAPIPEYDDIRPLVAQHHERLDGSGYPEGLVGDEILLGARILAVADSFDAMSCDRPYRAGLDLSQVLQELHRGAGALYDPAVVAALDAVIRTGVVEELESAEAELV